MKQTYKTGVIMRSNSQVVTAIAFAAFVIQSVALGQGESDALVSTSKSSSQWSASVDIIRPGDDVFWDKGAGGSVKYTMWSKPGLGLAVSAGVQKWDVNEEVSSYAADLGSGYAYGYAAQLKGDAQMIPLNVVGVWQYELGPSVKLNLEGGFSYVIVNSNVEYVELGAIGDGRNIYAADGYVTEVDIENNLMAIFAADLQYKANPSGKWTWFAGVGGQADITKGAVMYPFTPLSGYATGENEMKALFFRFGLAADL